MQHKKDELISQQIVLVYLGYYTGVVDGIWSDKTIEAKKKFECDDKYLPAAPTFGLPFAQGGRLPKGLRWDRGLLTHVNLTMDKIKEILDAHSPQPQKVVREPQKEQQKPVEEPAPAPEKSSKEGNKNAQG